jgi:hypothetical protein
MLSTGVGVPNFFLNTAGVAFEWLRAKENSPHPL